MENCESGKSQWITSQMGNLTLVKNAVKDGGSKITFTSAIIAFAYKNVCILSTITGYYIYVYSPWNSLPV